MSTILNTNGSMLEVPEVENPDTFNCYIITAEWNHDVTGALEAGAVETLLKAGVPESGIHRLSVPGTVELVNAAAAVMKNKKPEAIIVIGCVIRGDTPHFDYVCLHTTEGVASLNARGETPVIFGVLTVENQQQALDRAGGNLGNKGSEAAVAAIRMNSLHNMISDKK
ncbi:MAG: 6,7-dimethyl-8-ribityllumazine synthase [Muribaculaceae bacterium]|nr:6,7-dimethyl-8-ribityllumazine synthase [Muribaculaceae bacterium]